MPGNTWLANAAGYALAEKEHWEEANAKLEVAMRNPALAAAAAVRSARVRRLLASNPGLANYADLTHHSSIVDLVVKIRDGTASDPFVKAYRELANGKLEQAVLALRDSPMESRMLRLAAASKGAPQAMIEKTANLTVQQGLDRDTAWPAYGLALRMNNTAEGCLDLIHKEVGESFSEAKQFIELVKLRDFKKADAIARTFPLELRARLYLLAAVMLQDQVPQDG